MNPATAGFKIKFIPIMKDFYRDKSKCCLEIIPEISDIQNFNQMQWKEENSFIEYVIPMTYKIILKKIQRQTIKEISDNLSKIYYSCVDLLPSSSITELNFASGDVKQINSDTYVGAKTASSINSTNKIHGLTSKRYEDKNHEPANNQNSNDQEPVNTDIDDSCIGTDQTREDVQSHCRIDKATEDTTNLNTVKEHSFDKITNTESDFAIYTDAYTQSGETITCVSTIMNSSKAYSSGRLSQTPICSVDTEVTKEKIAANSVIYYINELKRETACITNICTINSIYREDYNINKVVTDHIKTNDNFSNALKPVTGRIRILPDVRVAELVQFMENEISPLKILLNKIISKCSALGLTLTNKRSQHSIMYKTIRTKYSDETNICNKPFKSNRVVYSIVFDE